MIKPYSPQQVKSLLEKYYEMYHHRSFIEDDPIKVVHKFKNKEDIEIAGFLTSIIAIGNRKQIINKANLLMQLMGNTPYLFIIDLHKKNLNSFDQFKHRTINGNDIKELLKLLHIIYTNHGGLENFFTETFNKYNDIYFVLVQFYKLASLYVQNTHCLKHISDVSRHSAGKRLNLFLRWMVRKDDKKIDFGLWKNIPPSSLYIPLDIHVSQSARKLGLLTLKQNNWRAVSELTKNLRFFDENDPVKYDYALFGIDIENSL